MARMKITPAKLAETEAAVDWASIDAMTDEDIERQNAADPDYSPLTDEQGVALRVQYVRKLTGLSQPAFAERFRIPVGTLRDWEQGRNQPDAAAMAYLTVIAREPEAVLRALDKPEAA
jgi:putative transcriptional regulator